MTPNILHPILDSKISATNFAAPLSEFDPEHTLFTKDFGRVNLRPISREDEAEMIAFHEGLSPESIYLRYFEHISLDTRTLHERLARVCTNTADSIAIVAETHGTPHTPAQILAVGRLTTTAKPNVTAFAVLISGKAEETQVPLELVRRLMAVARAYHFKTIAGEFLVHDQEALNICRSLGFNLHTVPEDGIVRVQCIL